MSTKEVTCIYGCGKVIGVHNTTGICRNCRRKEARKALKIIKRKLPLGAYQPRRRHAKAN